MGKLIQFPMNDLMYGFAIDKEYEDYYEEESYYSDSYDVLGNVGYSDINEHKKEVCLLSKLIKKLFCK
jgi:hypothetical protein